MTARGIFHPPAIFRSCRACATAVSPGSTRRITVPSTLASRQGAASCMHSAKHAWRRYDNADARKFGLRMWP